MSHFDVETGRPIPVAQAVLVGPTGASNPPVPGVQASPPSFYVDQEAQDRAYALQMQREQMQTVDKLELAIRHGFVRKVMGLLLFQVCLCMAVVCLFMYTPPIAVYCADNGWTWLVSLVVLLVAMISATSCCGDLPRRHPHNLFMSAGLAVLAGVFLGVISARAASAMRQDLVWIAFGATAGVMLILGLFACQTSVDFSGAGPYLSMAFLVLIMFALLGGVYQFATIALLWIAIIVFLMAMYVVYDVQLILGGKHRRFQFGVDDYALASLALFTDFVMILALFIGLAGAR